MAIDFPSVALLKANNFSDVNSLSASIANLGVQPNANLIRNGDFEIAQRGATFAAPNGYTIDGYAYYSATEGVVTVTQDTDVPTFAQAGHLSRHSLKVQVTSADTSIAAGQLAGIFHYVEGYDIYPAVGKTLTMSFWVKAKKTGVYCVKISNGAYDRTYVREYTIIAADTWEKKTTTFPMDFSGGTWNYTNGVGLAISWNMACGSTYQTTKDAWQSGNYLATSSQVNALDSTNNYINLAQVKLEIGSVATPFVPEPYAKELARNLRYLEVIRCNAFSSYGTGYNYSQTVVEWTLNYSPKRAIPDSVTMYGPYYINYVASNSTWKQTNATYRSIDRCMLNITTNTSMSAGSGCLVLDGGLGTSYIVVNAEL